MLHRINKYLFSGILVTSMLAFLLFTGCKKDENEGSTNEIRLEVFGPSPALRGGEIKFIGNNLDRVTAVVLPGGMEITDITIISKEEIRITIPQDAEPGLIVLKSPLGDITTKTPLTFSEPIAIEKISPTSVKAGDVLIIEGEYLNLIKEIIFMQDVVVESDNFVSQSREKIEIVVPEEAQTGKISLSNGAEIPILIYSEEEVQVVLPAVTSPEDLTAKKPGDIIVITGTDLDLVKQLIVPEDIDTEFVVSDEGKKITFTLSPNAKDGPVLMIPASGVKVALANIGMATVAELLALPSTEVRAGEELIIQGVNMELVTEVLFAGTETPVDINTGSATEIRVTVPTDAISGDVVLKTAAGKEATVVIVTAKSHATSYDNSTVGAGEMLSINGQHLDLLRSLTFGGNVTAEVSASSASSLTVKVPVTAESGTITGTMKNGEHVSFPYLTVEKPSIAYIPEMPSGEIANGTVWVVTIANPTTLTGVQLNNQPVQFIRSNNQLHIDIPSTISGNVVLKLISGSEEIPYSIQIRNSGIVETTIWEGSVELNYSEGLHLQASLFQGLKAGDYLKIYFTQINSSALAQFRHGEWGDLSLSAIGSNELRTSDVGGVGATEFEIKLTQSEVAEILRFGSWADGLRITGSGFTFQKVSIVDKGE